jgi:hypothetical protein
MHRVGYMGQHPQTTASPGFHLRRSFCRVANPEGAPPGLHRGPAYAPMVHDRDFGLAPDRFNQITTHDQHELLEWVRDVA